jgi:hypothetical protein
VPTLVEGVNLPVHSLLITALEINILRPMSAKSRRQ